MDDKLNFLFRVADVFDIKGRGCVLTPGYPTPNGIVPDNCKRGEVLLHLPDGTEINTTFIPEFALPKTQDRMRTCPICLARNIRKIQVPIGTEVWWIAARSTVVNRVK